MRTMGSTDRLGDHSVSRSRSYWRNSRRAMETQGIKGLARRWAKYARCSKAVDGGPAPGRESRLRPSKPFVRRDERPARTKRNYAVCSAVVCHTLPSRFARSSSRVSHAAHGSFLAVRYSRSSFLGPRYPRRSLFRGSRLDASNRAFARSRSIAHPSRDFGSETLDSARVSSPPRAIVVVGNSAISEVRQAICHGDYGPIVHPDRMYGCDI